MLIHCFVITIPEPCNRTRASGEGRVSAFVKRSRFGQDDPTIRAILAASATTACLDAFGLEDHPATSQSIHCSVEVSEADRAPWTSSFTDIPVASLADPRSFSFPPVEYSRGTRPNHAARSRAFWNCLPFPIAASSAVAPRAPIPGIVMSRRAASLSISECFDLPRDISNPLFPTDADHQTDRRAVCALPAKDRLLDL